MKRSEGQRARQMKERGRRIRIKREGDFAERLNAKHWDTHLNTAQLMHSGLDYGE